MTAPPDPIALVQEALARAKAAAKHDHLAMALATADKTGAPSVRMVLLRGIDARGLCFYTNRQSRKGDDLAANPRAALCLYWPDIDEQIRVEGTVEQVTDAESDAYFASRARESQLGAWSSRQSRPLESRAILLERFEDLTADYGDKPIPRPRWWGGYRVVPARIELWKAGKHRLHERTLYVREGEGWRSELLNP
jgi:pyridoxamine 5'-phosphate oxidase